MFCSKCGNEVLEGSYCGKCGAWVGDGGMQLQSQPQSQPQQQMPSQPAYWQPPVPQYGYQPLRPGYPQPHQQNLYMNSAAPGNFLEKLHHYGGSGLFLAGIILFSAGQLAAQIMTLSLYSIISIALTVLPIIAFWLIFAASKAPKQPEKTLPALTMFKVTIIFGLVIACLAVLLMLVVLVILFFAASILDIRALDFDLPIFGNIWSVSNIMTIIGAVCLVVVGVAIAFIIVYYRALLGLIGGIRNDIMLNAQGPLRGVGVFSVLTYIGAASSIISAISSIGASGIGIRTLDRAFNALPGELYKYSEYFMPLVRSVASNAVLLGIFLLVANIGIILCVAALGRFNNSLKYN